MFNILWRFIGLSTLFAQTQITRFNALKLKKLFSDSSNFHISFLKQNSLKKLFNIKFQCYIAVIGVFMTLHSIRKFAIQTEMITYNTSDIIEFFVPNMFPYPLSTLLHIHVSFIIAQNFFVLIGHDFLFIYLISITEIFLENLKESIENIKFNNNATRQAIANAPDDITTPLNAAQLGKSVEHCVMLHQHIIE